MRASLLGSLTLALCVSSTAAAQEGSLELDAPRLKLPQTLDETMPRPVPEPQRHRGGWLITGGLLAAGGIATTVYSGWLADEGCTNCTDLVYGFLAGAGLVTVTAAVLLSIGGVLWADVDRHNSALALDANGVGVRW